LLAAPVAALAAGLRHDLHLLDDGEVIDGFDHVVEGECGGARSGQCLHLHARDALGAYGRGDLDVVSARGEIHLDPGQRERVAQRDQVAGALGAHDPGQTRGRERLALGQLAARGPVHDVLTGAQHGASGRGARGDLLGGDVDHVGGAVGPDVREAGSWSCLGGRGIGGHESPPGISRVSSRSPSRTESTPTGMIASASAAAYPPMRCEDAPATSRTAPDGSTRARRYWASAGGDVSGSSSRTGRRSRRRGGAPRAGRAMSSQLSSAETGLPGKASQGTRRPSTSRVPMPCGPPGCIERVGKARTAPGSSAAWRTTSTAPMLTPPLVTTRSASWAMIWSRRCARSAAGSSGTASRWTTSAPASVSAAARPGPFASCLVPAA